MRQQRRLVLILAASLAALLFIVFFAPEPKTDIASLSEEEIAELLAPPLDTGAVVEEYVIVSAYLIIPADTGEPCGELLAIDLLSGEACSIPAEAKPNEIQFY